MGSYFWEWDILRAYEWACERRPNSPCVVGAVIELGVCLDLTTRSGVDAVRDAHRSFVELQSNAGYEIPVNRAGKSGSSNDLALRFLDKSVIDHLHQNYKVAAARSGGRIREFDTVRALFPEGNPIYHEAGFLEKTHVQIAVRVPERIRGVFRIPAHELRELNLPDLYASLSD